jgi:CTP:molybdopterin cytidylyltransferase MocA
MHILPAAGNAVRFGGIPKYLLPSDINGKSLLRAHIDAALAVDSGNIIVMSHPSMYQYLKGYLSDYSKLVVVDTIESKTMTETLIEGVERHGSPGEVISITLPDTITTGVKSGNFSGLIKESRTKGNCLMLYPHLEVHRGKFGQVLVSQQTGFVLDIIDKSTECDFLHIWGGISTTYETIVGFDRSEPTIGNCIKNSVGEGLIFNTSLSEDRYYDCGNMKDYIDLLMSIRVHD